MKRFKPLTQYDMATGTFKATTAAPKRVKRTSEANELTGRIVKYLTQQGHFATRLNSMGVFRDGQFTPSTQKAGLSDVLAVIDGRACFFEVKTGTDKPREAQLKRQTDIQDAGGFYDFVKTFEAFLMAYEALKK